MLPEASPEKDTDIERSQSQEQGRERWPHGTTLQESESQRHKIPLLTPAHLVCVSTAQSILILVKIITPKFMDQETEI